MSSFKSTDLSEEKSNGGEKCREFVDKLEETWIRNIRKQISEENVKPIYTLDEYKIPIIDKKFWICQVIQSFVLWKETSPSYISPDNMQDIFKSWIKYRNVTHKIPKEFEQPKDGSVYNLFKPMFKVFDDSKYISMQIIFPEGQRMFITKLESDLSCMSHTCKVINPEKRLKIYFCSKPEDSTFFKYIDYIIQGQIDSDCAHETMRMFLSSAIQDPKQFADLSPDIKNYATKILEPLSDKKEICIGYNTDIASLLH